MDGGVETKGWRSRFNTGRLDGGTQRAVQAMYLLDLGLLEVLWLGWVVCMIGEEGMSGREEARFWTAA